jgi:hypothetical protein
MWLRKKIRPLDLEILALSVNLGSDHSKSIDLPLLLQDNQSKYLACVKKK